MCHLNVIPTQHFGYEFVNLRQSDLVRVSNHSVDQGRASTDMLSNTRPCPSTKVEHSPVHESGSFLIFKPSFGSEFVRVVSKDALVHLDATGRHADNVSGRNMLIGELESLLWRDAWHGYLPGRVDACGFFDDGLKVRKFDRLVVLDWVRKRPVSECSVDLVLNFLHGTRVLHEVVKDGSHSCGCGIDASKSMAKF